MSLFPLSGEEKQDVSECMYLSGIDLWRQKTQDSHKDSLFIYQCCWSAWSNVQASAFCLLVPQPHAASALLMFFKHKEDTSSTQGSKYNLCWPKKSSNNNFQSCREDTDELCLVYFSCCALLTVLFTCLSVFRVLTTSVVCLFFLVFYFSPLPNNK